MKRKTSEPSNKESISEELIDVESVKPIDRAVATLYLCSKFRPAFGELLDWNGSSWKDAHKHIAALYSDTLAHVPDVDLAFERVKTLLSPCFAPATIERARAKLIKFRKGLKKNNEGAVSEIEGELYNWYFFDSDVFPANTRADARALLIAACEDITQHLTEIDLQGYIIDLSTLEQLVPKWHFRFLFDNEKVDDECVKLDHFDFYEVEERVVSRVAEENKLTPAGKKLYSVSFKNGIMMREYKDA